MVLEFVKLTFYIRIGEMHAVNAFAINNFLTLINENVYLTLNNAENHLEIILLLARHRPSKIILFSFHLVLIN